MNGGLAARAACILDGPIRANQFADSHESLEGSRTEPLLLRIAFWDTQHCESQVLRKRYENSLFFIMQIDCRESIRANRPDSCCESAGHLIKACISREFPNLVICHLYVEALFSTLYRRGRGTRTGPLATQSLGFFF